VRFADTLVIVVSLNICVYRIAAMRNPYEPEHNKSPSC